MEDEAADDKQTVTRSSKLSCGSSARSVATTTTVGKHSSTSWRSVAGLALFWLN